MSRVFLANVARKHWQASKKMSPESMEAKGTILNWLAVNAQLMAKGFEAIGLEDLIQKLEEFAEHLANPDSGSLGDIDRTLKECPSCHRDFHFTWTECPCGEKLVVKGARHG
jgi:hypothetical protein